MKSISLTLMMLSCAYAMYERGSDVVSLTADDFKTQVLQSDEVWIVEFYAPWCGHCKSLEPEYNKAATVLKGAVRVGAVDATVHEKLAQKYQIQGFPTIKVFGTDKKNPVDYVGERKSDALVTEGMRVVNQMVKDRKTGKTGSDKSSSSSGGGSTSSGSSNASGKKSGSNVVALTEDNFRETVLNSPDLWLVEFYAPWCGHCKNLAPEWEEAANKLKGSVKLGAVDATVHGSLAQEYGVKGYPTIKVFGFGQKKKATDYSGPREAGGIVDYAMRMLEESNVPPPTPQLTSARVFEESCGDGTRKSCVVMIVPHIYDSSAKDRQGYLSTFTNLAKENRGGMFSFVWTEAGAQPELEQAVGATFGFPALAVVSVEKSAYAIHRLSWSEKNLKTFLTALTSRSEKLFPLPSSVPAIQKVSAWDGKDATLVQEEEFSLDELMAD